MSDHYERLGLPRRFAIDRAELEREYLARSRAVHPDFHVSGPATALADSLEASAALNEAYNTLKDPFRRAEYLLALLGGRTAAEQKDTGQAFLMEMLEVREEIENARANQTLGETNRIRDDLEKRVADSMASVAESFAAGETSPATLSAIRRQLNEVRYLQGLLRDLLAD